MAQISGNGIPLAADAASILQHRVTTVLPARPDVRAHMKLTLASTACDWKMRQRRKSRDRGDIEEIGGGKESRQKWVMKRSIDQPDGGDCAGAS